MFQWLLNFQDFTDLQMPSMMFLSRNYVQMKTKLSEKTLISPIFENTNVTALFKTMMATNDDTKLL